MLVRTWLISMLLWAGAGACLAATPADDRRDLAEQYAAELSALADRCDRQGDSQAAGFIRRWLMPSDPLTLAIPLETGPLEKGTGVVFSADESPPGANPPSVADGRPTGADWQAELNALRHRQAERLWELATKAAAQEQFTAAYALVHETLREDPQHAAARRLLGYKLYEGRWLSPFESGKARAGQVWHDQFGWLPAGHVARYEGGERFYKGGWITAEDDARLHSHIDRGWEVATEHYLVRTNHSLQEGVRLADRLETLHSVWRQVFVRFYMTPRQLAALWNKGTPPAVPSRRHQVVYFRNRDEYIQALVARQPKIGISTGYYLADARTAYFFVLATAAPGGAPTGGSAPAEAVSAPDDSNVFHEATHQLFNESRGVARHLGRKANFWIVEGIACYMESLVEWDGFCTLGGAAAVRLSDARFRLLEDGFYVPFSELCGYGMARLQQDQRIAMLYSQSAGMAHFLMHYDQGRHRDALVDYLLAIYTGRDRPSSLAELTGLEMRELDQQYREFIAASAKTAF